MYVSPYGQSKGLPDRLDKWADDLSGDRQLPWMGLGIIADLRAAAAILNGKPVPIEEPVKTEVVFDL